MRVRRASPVDAAVGGAANGATKRVKGVPNRVRLRHAGPAVGTFGGALYGATQRVRSAPDRAR
eukprot:3811835-Pyramimonas_sp.AAC.1